MRPRDMIHYCNDVLTSYKSRAILAGETFSNDDVTQAREQYSQYLMNELEDEVPKHIPTYDLDIEVIKSLGTWGFTKDEFLAQAAQTDLAPSRKINPFGILSDLFEFSIVGYMRTGGVGGGSEYVWKYQDSRARFDPAATTFRVHPGLLDAWGLKQRKR